MTRKTHNWISSAIKHPGALHEQLGVPEDEPIPKKKLEAATHKEGKLGERARLAERLINMHKTAGIRTNILRNELSKRTPQELDVLSRGFKNANRGQRDMAVYGVGATENPPKSVNSYLNIIQKTPGLNKVAARTGYYDERDPTRKPSLYERIFKGYWTDMDHKVHGNGTQSWAVKRTGPYTETAKNYVKNNRGKIAAGLSTLAAGGAAYAVHKHHEKKAGANTTMLGAASNFFNNLTGSRVKALTSRVARMNSAGPLPAATAQRAQNALNTATNAMHGARFDALKVGGGFAGGMAVNSMLNKESSDNYYLSKIAAMNYNVNSNYNYDPYNEQRHATANEGNELLLNHGYKPEFTLSPSDLAKAEMLERLDFEAGRRPHELKAGIAGVLSGGLSGAGVGFGSHRLGVNPLLATALGIATAVGVGRGVKNYMYSDVAKREADDQYAQENTNALLEHLAKHYTPL